MGARSTTAPTCPSRSSKRCSATTARRGSLAGAFSSLFGGAPGRATGGPVTCGQAYVVGERGPELFVSTAAGQIATAGGAAADRDRL